MRRKRMLELLDDEIREHMQLGLKPTRKHDV